MEQSESQKQIWELIFDDAIDELSVGLSDSELNVIVQADEYEAAYTAAEARDLATGMLSVHHQRGWGDNIPLTADYLCDLADVADNELTVEAVEQKWEHDGEPGTGLEYTITTEVGDPVMSFDSITEAMRFCEDWNQRPGWTITYRLESDGDEVPIWGLSDTEGELVAARLEAEIARLISSADDLDWDVAVEYWSNVPAADGNERICAVEIRNNDNKKERYKYQLYYAEHGGGINASTTQPERYRQRIRIDRQRGRLLEAMSTVPKQLGLYFGPPDADLELMQFNFPLNLEYDSS